MGPLVDLTRCDLGSWIKGMRVLNLSRLIPLEVEEVRERF